MSMRRTIMLAATLLALYCSQFGTGRAFGQAEDQNVIYMPLINNFESIATPQPTPAQQVVGQLGRLVQARGESYDSLFLTNRGQIYALVGVEPEIERQLVRLRNQSPPVAVKVWGTFDQQAADDVDGTIIASGLLESGRLDSYRDDAGPMATVDFALVSLYGEPDRSSRRVGFVTLGQVCKLSGRDLLGSWWNLDCGNDVIGWIDGRLVSVTGNSFAVSIETSSVTTDPVSTPLAVRTATPLPTLAPPTPTPASVAAATSAWRASYFNNAQMIGSPATTADVAAVNFNWGTGAPRFSLGSDNFAVRFERTLDFAPGYYRFQAHADDGLRVWIDNEVLIDEWHGSTDQTYIVGRTLSGLHDVRVEYYEASGLASVRFDYDFVGEAPDWSVAYHSGTDLRGPPLLVQQEPKSAYPLDYNWGYSGPASGLGLAKDFWSARWEGDFIFEAGDYLFQATSDDGVRVYLNDLLVINSWGSGYSDVSNRVIGIGTGVHTVRVEYYERTGLASLRVWWQRDPSNQISQ